MDITKEELDAPAFPSVPAAAGEDKVEDRIVENPADPQPEASDEEEGRVKYSKFKRTLDRAKEAEREAEFYRQQAQRYQEAKPEPKAEDLPDAWRKMLGDSDQAKEVYQTFQSEIRSVREQALQDLRAERQSEAAQVEQNQEILDENLESVSEFVGRDLTPSEESSLLDLALRFTPTGPDGRFLQNPDFEKLWEIHELQAQASRGSRTRSRDSVASISGAASKGEPAADRDSTFNPSWGAIGEAVRRRVG